jgi:hypothetical protein
MIRRTPLLLVGLLIPALSAAVEMNDLAGHDDLFGRYAPGGDCKRQPQIVAEKSGLTFEVAGQKENVSRVEYVFGYYGPDYQGIQKVIFPFKRTDGEYAIIMEFNHGEKPGALAISGHGEGFAGGPPFSARNKALVDASPYARCK